MQVKKVNNCIVKPQKLVLDYNHGQCIEKGNELFPNRFSNIFLLGRRRSGKSVCLSYIVRSSVTKKTVVICFSSTVNKDRTIIGLLDYLQNKGIAVVSYDGIFDDYGNNRIEWLLEHLKAINLKDDEDFIVIFDDLSDQINNPRITAFIKTARHFNTKLIISSQYLVDMNKGARAQLDYLLLFGGQPEEKLITIYKQLDIGIDLADFIQLYYIATEKKYQFLWCSIRDNQFRINFDEEFVLQD